MAEVKQALVEAAARVLAEEGPAALTVRRLATEVGTSTMAVYTGFGGKGGLLGGVRDEAFARFHRRLSAIRRTDDPMRDLRALGLAYRRFALAEPHLYQVMFGPVLSAVAATAEQDEAAYATFAILSAAVARAAIPDPGSAARQLWAAVHGFVLLELSGVLPERHPARAYDRLLDTVGIGLLARRPAGAGGGGPVRAPSARRSPRGGG